MRNKLDFEKVKADTLAHIELMQHKNKIIVSVTYVMKQFEGKQINKRFETAVNKKLGDKYIVSLSSSGGSHKNIFVWGNGIDFDKRMMIFIGYINSYNSSTQADCSNFSFDVWMKEHSPQYIQYNQMIAEAQEKIVNVKELVANYNYALDQFDFHRRALDAFTIDE